MPEQPSPIADTRKPCPNCRYFIATPINCRLSHWPWPRYSPLWLPLLEPFSLQGKGTLAAPQCNRRAPMPRCAWRMWAARLSASQRKKRRPAMGTLSRLGLIAGATLLLAAGSAMAQPVDMAAAKREGKVVWYCSVPIETAQKVANMFEKETSIKVELFRSGGSNILRRFQQEAEGGKIFVDVLTHSEPEAARAMARKNLFVAFKPTDFDKVPPEVKDPNGYYIAQRLNVMALYVRDDKLPVTDRPKTWPDLADPKYRGKMVMADPSFSSLLVTLVGMLAKENGWDYFEKLRKNDVMLVQGNQQVADMVKRGERTIAVGADATYI